MTLKKLLVAFTTTRAVSVDGKDENRRVRFASGTVVDLTGKELDVLDRLAKSTGKLHYREPINEGGGGRAKVVADEPEVVELPDYSGQATAVADKTVPQLKAYLDFHGLEYDDGDLKPALLDLAQKHEAGQIDDEPDADQDSGL